MGNYKYKIKEVEFIDPIPEKDFKPKGSEFEGIIYVDDPRIPESFLKKIEQKFGPIPKGSYFSGNFSMYWEKLEPDYGGEVGIKGSKSVSNQYRLPTFAKIFTNFTEMRDDVKFISKNKDVAADPEFAKIFDELNKVFNKYRTHLRKNYPGEYELILKSGGLKGDLGGGLDEMSTTGGGAGAAGFTPGTGMQYATPYAFKRKKKKNLKEEIDLDSYGYKLVPKDKKGNYVQKGSKLDVVNLFEDAKSYQDSRIKAFDSIEQELNDIYKMLSNAKNETSDYYNDNPSSYSVIKPTDLVLDYIKDIKNLLKGE